jgi:hypothetical protein
MATQADIKAKLDALQADVAALPEVEQSVVQLLTNLIAQIADLRGKLANADIDPALLDEADAITAAIDQHKAGIAADVAANTPAAPAS